MSDDLDSRELKTVAARKALGFLKNGMLIGLGSGSTASLFNELLGEALQTGWLRDIRAVPTSDKTAAQAVKLGIPLVSLTNAEELDLAVDGADEVDPALNLIKGLGRALLREKIIEIHARRFIVIVDEIQAGECTRQPGAFTGRNRHFRATGANPLAQHPRLLCGAVVRRVR